MKVPVFKGDGNIEYIDRPQPVLDEFNNVLIRVLACGVCGTDLNILSVPPLHKAKADIIIGHEAVGEIIDLGSKVNSFSRGDRVVIAPRIVCNDCEYCRMGLHNQCSNYQTVGTSRDGGFAPYLAIPHSALYPISTQVDIEEAALFEPLSCVIGAISRVPFQLGDRVAIIGAGPMGALFALCYQAMGASSVYMLDISQSRLDFIKDKDIAKIVNTKDMNKDDILQLSKELSIDLSVDAVGNQIDLASQLPRRGGNSILFGLKAGKTQEVEQYHTTRYDITLHGCFVGLHPFVQTIKVLESNLLNASRIISHRFPLTNLMDAIDLMRKSEGMKMLIHMEKDSE